MAKAAAKKSPTARSCAEPASPEAALAGFIAKFAPPMQQRIKAARAAMRRRLPTANELVYDNYNFFVIGYGASERPSDCLLSLAANAKGIGLSFYYGSTLPDPSGLLEGSGSQNRFVRLESTAILERPEVEALIQAAIDQQDDPPLPATGKGRLIIRSVSAKQRPRR